MKTLKRVFISFERLKRIPTIFKDIKIATYFDCSDNDLRSLENCPAIAKDFDCSYNRKLTSLIGGPKEVRGNYVCKYCSLKSLEGAPDTVSSFDCSGNKLESLEGLPKIVEILDVTKNPGRFTAEYIATICTFNRAYTDHGVYDLDSKGRIQK